MKPKIVDYTKLLLGTVTRQWTYTDKETGKKRKAKLVIAICPKCGRKGERVERTKIVEYRHLGKITEVIKGFPMMHIKDHCTVWKTDEP